MEDRPGHRPARRRGLSRGVAAARRLSRNDRRPRAAHGREPLDRGRGARGARDRARSGPAGPSGRGGRSAGPGSVGGGCRLPHRAAAERRRAHRHGARRPRPSRGAGRRNGPKRSPASFRPRTPSVRASSVGSWRRPAHASRPTPALRRGGSRGSRCRLAPGGPRHRRLAARPGISPPRSALRSRGGPGERFREEHPRRLAPRSVVRAGAFLHRLRRPRPGRRRQPARRPLRRVPLRGARPLRPARAAARRSQRIEEVEAELPLEALDAELVDELSRLEPHGASNPVPVFLARGVRARRAARVRRRLGPAGTSRVVLRPIDRLHRLGAQGRESDAGAFQRLSAAGAAMDVLYRVESRRGFPTRIEILGCRAEASA